MDFTLEKYTGFLLALRQSGYEFVAFKEYVLSNEPIFSPAMDSDQSPIGKSHWVRADDHDATPEGNAAGTEQKRVILRHDVDRLPANSLRLAILEQALGVKGSYYFRVVPESYDRRIIKQIAELGHEIGYHYEDVDLASKRSKVKSKNWSESDLIDLAYESFRRNLEALRKDFDVKTACMHGSPRSRYDNRIIWTKYNYRDLGIIGEPYFDIDFDRVAYFTDTGRRWNGGKVNVRDHVASGFEFDLKSTRELIDHILEFPPKVMINAHPHRWFDPGVMWLRELVIQNVKNGVKYFLSTRREDEKRY